MIDYPDDQATQVQAEKHGIPEPVLIRDLVRIVEVINLEQKGFFGERSVLAGSMALRCFGSPRFTVFDADFSAEENSGLNRAELLRMLRYEDEDLTIEPSELTPSHDGSKVWKSEPIRYEPLFTALTPNPEDRRFKVDISYRGLVCPGQEVQLDVPYDLGLWDTAPAVWVMDPHEVTAEKILGWCAHRLTKHYADLGFIAIATTVAGARIELQSETLRDVLATKLEMMRALQPSHYTRFESIDDLTADLARKPQLAQTDWSKLVYIRAHRDRFNLQLITRAVREVLVPKLRP